MPFYFFKKEVFEEEEKPYQELEPSPTSHGSHYVLYTHQVFCV